MKKIHYILASVLLLIGSSVFAQQEGSFAFYKYHMNTINPAYAGVDEQTVITSSLRNQWSGIADAPKTQAVSFGMPIANNLGFGVSVVNSSTFIEKQTAFDIQLSYKVKMNENTDLYLGINAGGNTFNLNTAGLELYSVEADPAFGSIHTFNPNFGAGALLKTDKFYVSLSVPKLLNIQKGKNDNGYATVENNRPRVYLSGGYDFNLNPTGTLVLKPSILARYVTATPFSVDFSTMLQIQNNFEVGALYRTDKAYAAMANFILNKKFIIGYAYEMSAISTMASAKNTNEILLQYKF
ncbi:MAG: type IX secretion system membrane protein PorP/SprF [Crocinitomicaceae bacterium]|jgi:type IX secretion system PorP/SprF family membrane protein|nr:type IX secretion system membrane protein PorP/SprF [Crocinitomicaceae bacterium]